MSTGPIDPRDNTESRGAESEASQTAGRASNSGPVPTPPRPAGAVPGVPDESDGVADRSAGTSAGDPTAGVRISDEDAAHAVPGDEGPEHPGRR